MFTIGRLYNFFLVGNLGKREIYWAVEKIKLNFRSEVKSRKVRI